MRRLLVTGLHGFVGSCLARMGAVASGLQPWQLAEVPIDLDLREPEQVQHLVETAQPNAVLHLAALSNVPDSFREPETTLAVNLFGTLHLLQALKRIRFAGPIAFVSSGDVYGLVPESELPITESRPPAPRNPYAVSKVAAEALCKQWSATEGMDIRIARSFNHIGPGQSDSFVASSLARQIAAIKAGRRAAVLEVGDIDVTRDFSDVCDVVRAYLLLLEHGEPGEIYNVCSGIERSIRQLIERMTRIAGVDVDVRQELSRLRPAEQRRVCGSSAKIRSVTGWEPLTPLDESLKLLLEYWSNQDAALEGHLS